MGFKVKGLGFTWVQHATPYHAVEELPASGDPHVTASYDFGFVSDDVPGCSDAS